MSNHLSMAAVTETLKYRLYDEVREKVPGTEVTIKRPSAADVNGADKGPKVNIFMYRAGPNEFLRNDDLPTRDSSGSFIQPPKAALNLDYVFSFYGDEDKHEPQRLMGITVSRMHAYPVLERDEIQSMINAKADGHYLKNSDLAQSEEAIKISPLTFTLEEMFKLFSAMQAPYALSTAYQARVVLIESEIKSRAGALPVRG